ncbi:MAG: bifunctional oligoribonuclease/PAP phosphatase NrnA [Verrucomicrobiota bacterium]
MNTHCTLDDIGSLFHSHSRFLVLSHFRPDGDAIGCSLALSLCLQQLGKDVTVWNEDGLPERFRFLPGSHLIQLPPKNAQDFDVVIIVDTAVRNRVGETCLRAIGKATVWINIDHHVSNDRLGDFVYVDTKAPAAGQILFELFTHCHLPLDRAIATSLYAAISTDTGSFQYPSTTDQTYFIASELVKLGIDVGTINQELYERSPRRRLELLRALLNVLQFSSNDQVASFALSQETSRALGTIPDDTEGLIDTIRALDGVIVAAFFEELPDEKIRISLRSKTPRVDVCAICGEFGGGGHILAAGARSAGTLAEVQAKVLAAIDRRIRSLNT